MYCTFCGARREGKIFQEGARWMARLSCGHISFKGWVQDPDELERLGMVNSDKSKDPRAEAKMKQEQEDKLLEAQENVEREIAEARKRGDL